MAIRPIDGNKLLSIIRLLDTDIVRQNKTASWLLDQVLHDIQSMPALDTPNQWISVKDRLPEEDQKEAYKWFEENICSTAMPGAREAYQVAIATLGPVSLEQLKRVCDHCEWKYCRPPEEKNVCRILKARKMGG